MSSEQLAIQVRELSKYYYIYQKPEDRLKQYIMPRLQRMVGRQGQYYYREFKALADINFEVNKGEAVGIIGRNGAGKSTLLQLICGTLTPTSGEIKVNGNVAALLELGSGFNPEFTGRENVYLNASILGLTSQQTDAKFDEIAEFADIGEYIDQSTKTYSSGMLMRLAFAVNTCIEPDILIVDEALSVGDAPFQSKCFKRLRRLIENGTTILFVSHDISTVRSICSRALWLKNGNAEMWGDAMDVSKHYEKFCWEEQGVVMETSEPSMEKVTDEISANSNGMNGASSFPSILYKPNPVYEKNRIQTRTGTGQVIIKNFLMMNEENEIVSTCCFNDKLRLFYLLEVCEPVNSDIIVGFRIRDLKGNFVYSANDLNTIHRLVAKPGERYVVSSAINIPLTHQDYIILTGVFGFNDGSAFSDGKYDFTNSVIWDVIEDAAFLKVEEHKLMPLAGPVNTSYEINIIRIN